MTTRPPVTGHRWVHGKRYPRHLEVTGYMVQHEFHTYGGIRLERLRRDESRNGRSEEVTTETRRIVDDVEMLQLSNSIVTRAHYVLSQRCVSTPIGWFVDPAGLKGLDEAFDEVRRACEDFNKLSRTVGSARRVECEIYMLELSENNERVSMRLSRVVRDNLKACLETFRRGHDDKFEAFDDARLKCKNLHRIASGIQADAIILAVDHLNAAKPGARRLVKEGGKPMAEVLAAWDMEPVDAAVALFKPINWKAIEDAETAESMVR